MSKSTSTLITNATGVITPAPEKGPAQFTEPQTVTVEWVKDVDGMILARCQYPEDYIRHHQLQSLDDVDGLLQMVTKTFSQRYGTGMMIQQAPTSLAEGTTLVFGA